jgi:hypothetical protein
MKIFDLDQLTELIHTKRRLPDIKFTPANLSDVPWPRIDRRSGVVLA